MSIVLVAIQYCMEENGGCILGMDFPRLITDRPLILRWVWWGLSFEVPAGYFISSRRHLQSASDDKQVDCKRFTPAKLQGTSCGEATASRVVLLKHSGI